MYLVLGIVTQLRIVRLSNIWIVLISSIIATTPSLLGVSMSRYWMMFYIPFIIFAGALMYNILSNIKTLDAWE